MKARFIGERVSIGGRIYTVRALLPSTHGVTVESVDGFRTDVDADCIDDEPPSFRRVAGAVDALREPQRCNTCALPLERSEQGGAHCDRCWEVEHRLADYLRRGGASAVFMLLKAIRTSGLFPSRPPRPVDKKGIIV